MIVFISFSKISVFNLDSQVLIVTEETMGHCLLGTAGCNNKDQRKLCNYG